METKTTRLFILKFKSNTDETITINIPGANMDMDAAGVALAIADIIESDIVLTQKGKPTTATSAVRQTTVITPFVLD